MAERRRIGMLLMHHGTPRDREAREQLGAALPDGAGVWDAVAASGTDDHIVFLEHPDLPQHWRRVSGRPGG
jgi:hypothetical protein